MEIPNPRRILLLGPANGGHLDLLKSLTGTKLPPSSTPLAGQTHTWALRTAYYHTTLSIWLDEIPAAAPTEWSAPFLEPEAREVLEAIGAFVVVVRKPGERGEWEAVKGVVREVGKVVKGGCGAGWEGVCLVVGMKGGFVVSGEEWEDFLAEVGVGWEFVDGEGRGKNEFGELQGITRVIEALEANEWAGNDEQELDFEDLDGDDDGSTGFGLEAAELEMEMFGMKSAVHAEEDGIHSQGESRNLVKGEDEDDDVDKLEAMMLKMRAVRDMGADLPEAERKKFAAKAVNDLMKTL